MSRNRTKILPLPKGVTLAQKPGLVSVKGPKGELTKAVPTGVTIKTEADKITGPRAPTTRARTAPSTASCARTSPTWSRASPTGWTRELEINGVGYRAEVAGDTIDMALGYSHPVVFKLPKGVTAKVDKNRVIADRARTATWSARPPRRCASCVLPSRTRARASSTSKK